MTERDRVQNHTLVGAHIRDGDGYQLHTNPDGQSCWFEGHDPGENVLVLTASDMRQIDECITRRGLDVKFNINWLFGDATENEILIRQIGIWMLESKYCGEELL